MSARAYRSYKLFIVLSVVCAILTFNCFLAGIGSLRLGSSRYHQEGVELRFQGGQLTENIEAERVKSKDQDETEIVRGVCGLAVGVVLLGISCSMIASTVRKKRAIE